MRIFTSTILKFNFLTAILVIGLLNLSCKKTPINTPAIGETKVKMINSVNTEQPQNIFIDQNKLEDIALSFAQESDYFKLQSGDKTIKFSSSVAITIEKDVNYTSSLTYTTFLIADKTGVKDLYTIEDNLSTSEADKAKIRIINLSPNFSTGINVLVAGGVQFVNAQMFKEISNYFFVDPALDLKYNVVGSGSVKTIIAGTLKPGKTYNIWFSGINATNLEAHISNN